MNRTLPAPKYIYLLKIEADYSSRKLTLCFTDNPVIQTVSEILEFVDISSFSYVSLEVDDDCLDSLIGIHLNGIGEYVVHTEKNEFIFKASNFLLTNN